jgi:hypothetical protein
MSTTTKSLMVNKTDAGNGSYDIGCVTNASRLPIA